jgi:hypothetical protein
MFAQIRPPGIAASNVAILAVAIGARGAAGMGGSGSEACSGDEVHSFVAALQREGQTA